MTTNADLSNVVTPYLTDVGFGLVFGLGYYFIKYLYGDADKKTQTKAKNVEGYWSTAKTIDDFNILIKNNEEDPKMNPFEVLDLIKKKYLSPDINTYNNLLNACFVNSNFHVADKLSEQILDSGSPVQPDLSTYNILLKGISCKLDDMTAEEDKANEVAIADKYFEDIAQHSFHPNDITINTMLDILIKGNQFKRAWDLFDVMKSKYNVEPDKYSYSTIIKALKYELDPTKIERAFGILNYLRKQNVSGSDEIIFNCLIEVCLKLKMVDKAEKVYQEMNSLGVSPSKVTYAIMIKGYGQVYDLTKALNIFEEMKQAEVRPNEIIYGCLLNACVRCSNIQKVTEIYQEMLSSNITLNIIIYTTLIKAYAKAKDLNKALEIYNTMLNDKNVKPNIVIHNAMLDACVECRDPKKMTEIYEQIKELALSNESNPLPDLITYSTVIKGYARAKDMDSVFKIYQFLQGQEKEFVLDEVIYNSILDGCVKTEKYEKALEVYRDMQSHNVKGSNVTYSILVKLYTNQGENEKAFTLLDEMRKNGVKPGIIVYTCLIQSSFKSKNYKRALALFETLKSEGLQADYVLYNTVVNGCLYHSQWEQACKYTLESFDKNVRMANNIYKNVLDKMTMNYCHMNIDLKCEYATKILKQLKDKGVSIEDPTYKKISQMIYKNNSTTQNMKKYQKYRK